MQPSNLTNGSPKTTEAHVICPQGHVSSCGRVGNRTLITNLPEASFHPGEVLETKPVISLDITWNLPVLWSGTFPIMGHFYRWAVGKWSSSFWLISGLGAFDKICCFLKVFWPFVLVRYKGDLWGFEFTNFIRVWSQVLVKFQGSLPYMVKSVLSWKSWAREKRGIYT